VTGVEMFRKVLDDGQAGDNIGALSELNEAYKTPRGTIFSAGK